MSRTVTFLFTIVALLIIGQQASAQQQYEVSFKSLAGKFVVAENGGGGAVKANRDEKGPWERFTIIDLNEGELVSGDVVNIRSVNGLYVVAENGGGGVVQANRKAAGPWEKFTISRVAGDGVIIKGVITNGDTIVLQSLDDHYVVAENAGDGVVNANRTEIGAWEKFTILLNCKDH